MAFLPVPWAVEGGAKNPPEGARILAYAATQGNDGVFGFADLRVSQTTTASAGVAVATGAAVIPCRSSGYAYQAYIASRPVGDEVVSVPANGGASTRYDLVVARVENPHLSSEAWPMPADVTVGPYVAARVYTNVAASVVASRAAARAYLKSISASAIPLAKIALPASTSAVLNSHLTDLRGIANPRHAPQLLTFTPAARTNLPTTFGDWFAPAGWQFDIPEWATHMTASAVVLGTRMDRQSSGTDGQSAGDLRIRLSTGATVTYSATTKYDLTAPSSGGTTTRFTIGVADTMLIPVGLRGTLQALAIQGDQTSGNQPLYGDATTTVTLNLDFTEQPT